jgi:membrane protease subunit HflK
MIWQSEGGGPWGTGPRGGSGNGGGGPWGSGRGGGQSGGSPRGPRGPQPPNLEDILRRSQDRFRQVIPGGFGGGTGIIIAVIAVAALWLASGFYRVLPDEVGVVLRFGAYNRTTPPGLGWHLPAPIESVLKPSVTHINRIEIGYRSTETRGGQSRQLPEEALMLTGDENIVDINFTVFWLIKDAQAFLFNIRNPEATVKSAAESAMREVVGETPIAQALAEGRGKIEQETQRLLQRILDMYGSGIDVTQVQMAKVDPPAPVIDAFRDVQRALADRERLRNEAEAYRNDILPRARGDAVRIRQEAEAYRAEIVARAQGDADRFLAVYNAFKAARDVTLQRLYLETMEDILKNSKKVIIDKAAEGQSGVLPYLPLPDLLQSPGTAAGSAPSSPQAAPPSSTGGASSGAIPPTTGRRR